MANEYKDPEILTENKDSKKTYALHTSNDLDPLLDRIGNAHFVLLGEASHGTHEYYTWRTKITKRLIQEKGFRFIAVEGDWPDCYKINRYVKGYDKQTPNAETLLKKFLRWPTWMWANWEMVALIEWLKKYNQELPQEERIGFYGLDVYSLWESMETIMRHLEATDQETAEIAKKAFRCFEPYKEKEYEYAFAQHKLSDSCREPLTRLLTEIKNRNPVPVYEGDPEEKLNMEQNAWIAVDAERYYASMIQYDQNSWNIRDQHMTETLNRLIDFHGTKSKIIVWEHNTHIGDARYTDMHKAGMVNVGQLVREKYSMNESVLVGFGSYQGTVIAGNYWGAPFKKMSMPPAQKGSIENLLHEESSETRLLLFDHQNEHERFGTSMLHRAIGVVYEPDKEQYGNYVPTILNARYDAFIFIDQTKALHPIYLNPDLNKIPDTYPFDV